MNLVISIPRARVGEAFGSRPEGLPIFVSVVLGEQSLQVTDSEVVVTLKLITC
jgi:hypothetical protein